MRAGDTKASRLPCSRGSLLPIALSQATLHALFQSCNEHAPLLGVQAAEQGAPLGRLIGARLALAAATPAAAQRWRGAVPFPTIPAFTASSDAA